MADIGDFVTISGTMKRHGKVSDVVVTTRIDGLVVTIVENRYADVLLLDTDDEIKIRMTVAEGAALGLMIMDLNDGCSLGRSTLKEILDKQDTEAVATPDKDPDAGWSGKGWE